MMRPCPAISIPVSRRAGGLEIKSIALPSVRIVSRRAGGLEITADRANCIKCVSRRAGGLEMAQRKRKRR